MSAPVAGPSQTCLPPARLEAILHHMKCEHSTADQACQTARDAAVVMGQALMKVRLQRGEPMLKADHWILRALSAAALSIAFSGAVLADAATSQSSADHRTETAEDTDVSATTAVITHHSGTFNAQSFKYTATAGRIPVDGPNGAVDAQFFYVAYTRDGASTSKRPLTFLTNGGPGAATAWLHLGGIGPVKIDLEADGATPPPPSRVIPNPESILDRTDLVFVDAPGTGYSRAANDAAKTRLFTRDGDLNAYAEFVLRYLALTHRWGSPVFLFGESYGGMRMAGLSDHLIRRGVPLSGVVLLSAVIDSQTLTPSSINELPYVLEIPSYATIAAFHGKSDPSLPKDGDALRAAAQRWAEDQYAPALSKGTRLTEEERARVARDLVKFTGLPQEIIEKDNLRIDVPTFMRYLLPGANLVVGRVDGRMSGPAPASRVEEPFYDPAMGSLTPAFTSAASQYLADELGYAPAMPYRMYSQEVATRFELMPAAHNGNEGYEESLGALQSTVVKNAAFRLLSMNGIYDLACPYWSMEYSIDHMPIPASYRANIKTVRLDGGHMAYDDRRGLHEIAVNVRAMMDPATAAVGR